MRLLDNKGHRKVEMSEEQRIGDRMVNTWLLIRKWDNLVVTAPQLGGRVVLRPALPGNHWPLGGIKT